jgi:hypothetical protein
VLRQEWMNPGERPGDGTIPRAAIEIWLGWRSQSVHLFCAGRKRKRQSNKGSIP